jgi:ligand-binding sensor domain-containing protein
MDSRLFSVIRVGAAVGAVVALAAVSCQSPRNPIARRTKSAVSMLPPARLPAKDTVYTSSREVLQLSIDQEGNPWAATTGGVLYLDGSNVCKWTRLNGLPSHEVQAVASTGKRQAQAWFPNALAEYQDHRWKTVATQPQPAAQRLEWDGKDVSWDAGGLKIGQESVGFPAGSLGSHLTSVLPYHGKLLVSIFGDGFWFWDGSWSREPQLANLPEAAREITAAFSTPNGSLWVGTRRDGIWRFQNGGWQNFPAPDEPYNHNIQYLAEYGGAQWASTLDDGLVVRTGRGWRHFGSPEISSNAARQLVTFQKCLWIRHGDGYIDRWDGSRFARNIFAFIPRKKALSLASDGLTLAIGQWGGWSEWDGKTWTHHFDLPELKDVPLVGISIDAKYVWLLTQSRGVVRWDRQLRQSTVLDERLGLPDDWVTCLTRSGDKVYAGTFVGGLARLDGGRWVVYPELKGENVTALEPDGQGGVWVATRHGVWRVRGERIRKLQLPWLDEEAQALRAEPGGLWVGTRTSLNWVKQTSLEDHLAGQ